MNQTTLTNLYQEFLNKRKYTLESLESFKKLKKGFIESGEKVEDKRNFYGLCLLVWEQIGNFREDYAFHNLGLGRKISSYIPFTKENKRFRELEKKVEIVNQFEYELIFN